MILFFNLVTYLNEMSKDYVTAHSEIALAVVLYTTHLGRLAETFDVRV